MGDKGTVAMVAMSHAAYSFDAEYSYLVPEKFRQKLRAGMRVFVSFGRGNNRVIGLVTRICDDDGSGRKLKPILAVVDSECLVTDEILKIIFWLKENTFCTYYDAFRTAVPTGFSYKADLHYAPVNTYIQKERLSPEEAEIIDFLEITEDQQEIDKFLDIKAFPERKKPLDMLIDKGFVEETQSFKRKVGDESVKMAALAEGYEDAELTPKQKKVVELLEECGAASVKELCYMTGCTATIIKRLCDKNAVRVFEQEVMRDTLGEITERESPDDITLNEEQTAAFDGIMALIRAGKPAAGEGERKVPQEIEALLVKSGERAEGASHRRQCRASSGCRARALRDRSASPSPRAGWGSPRNCP